MLRLSKPTTMTDRPDQRFNVCSASIQAEDDCWFQEHGSPRATALHCQFARNRLPCEPTPDLIGARFRFSLTFVWRRRVATALDG